MYTRLNDFSPSPGARILILQDEPTARSILMELLVAAGHRVETTAHSAQALSLLTDGPYDVLVLDLDNAHPDGVAFLQNVSKLQPGLQIVVLTGKPTLRTAIAAIRVGAADYLVKPIDAPVIVEAINRSLETLAGLKNQLARLVREAGRGVEIDVAELAEDPTPNSNPVIIVPPVRLDYAKRKATLYNDPGRTIDLSRGEVSVLASLMSNPDQPVPTERLAREAWNYELDGLEAGELIRPYIFRLRRKLELCPDEPELILTVRGQGYLFVSSRQSYLLNNGNSERSE
jgi:DNA-binding response OmpR family regulator